MNKINNIQGVDLFCGAGGLTCGLKRAGIDMRLGVDFDDSCRHAYEHNNNTAFWPRSVTDITGDDLASVYDNGVIRMLAGCAPCQTFSTHAHGAKSAVPDDKRWGLPGELYRIINELRPEIVFMENVPGLADHAIFKSIIEDLRNSDYHVDCQIIDCADHGVPQRRKRLILLASRLGPIFLHFFQAQKKRRTVRDAIGHLPAIAAGETHPDDPLHRAAGMHAVNMERIRASKPAGTWRDWPEHLRLDGRDDPKKAGYYDVYGRMCWDDVSPTLTTDFHSYSTGRFGHPEQDRAISLREGALLQTFPQDYQFVPRDSEIFFSRVSRMVGNAVPPLAAQAIGELIVEHVREMKK